MYRHLMLTTSLVLAGCTWHSTSANEVGVLTRKISFFGEKGVQQQIYASGATYFFPAFITDWHTFETKLQNLRMTKVAGSARRAGDIEFKTVDGNDVSVDVTVTWRINPAKTPHVLQRVGESAKDVQERLVRPAARAYVRDSLNRLKSEDFYVADKRFAAAEEAKKLLSSALTQEGVIIEQIILGEHRFNPAYEEVIRDKKLAEQNAEKLKSEATASSEEAKRNLEAARGIVSQKLAKAKGGLEQMKLEADALLVKAKNEGEAIVAESAARAKGIRKETAALAGTGGRTMVKLRIAEALRNKRVIMIPSGSTLNTLDINQLIGATIARKVSEKQQRKQQQQQQQQRQQQRE